MAIIKDGTGSGNSAQVDAHGRLHVEATTVAVEVAEAFEGHSYDVSTQGLVTLTTDNDSALLYIKNNGNEELLIQTIFTDSNSSTGGTGQGTMKWHMNPTSGTLISDAEEAQVLNRRIGSPIGMDSDAFKASATDKTLVSVSQVTIPLPAGAGIPFAGPWILQKGQAFGVSYQPPTGNTSMTIQIGFLVVVNTTV